MTKIAGSGSGSISQRHGSVDPDPEPHQNVMVPHYCCLLFIGAEERVRGARDQTVLHALHGKGLFPRPHAVPHHQQLHRHPGHHPDFLDNENAELTVFLR
jgi:hypothetical protein